MAALFSPATLPYQHNREFDLVAGKTSSLKNVSVILISRIRENLPLVENKSATSIRLDTASNIGITHVMSFVTVVL